VNISPMQGHLRQLRSTLTAYKFFQGEGQFSKISGAGQYLSDIYAGLSLRIQNSILRVGEGSSVLGIKFMYPNLTKFDVVGVRRSTLEAGSTLGPYAPYELPPPHITGGEFFNTVLRQDSASLIVSVRY